MDYLTDACSAPYRDGLAHGVLRYQRCAACGQATSLARTACPHCGAQALAWHDARGTGRVQAVTVVTRAPADAFRALVPYTLVLVDLDEGARVMGHGMPGLRIGDAVRAAFFQPAGQPLPRFELLP